MLIARLGISRNGALDLLIVTSVKLSPFEPKVALRSPTVSIMGTDVSGEREIASIQFGARRGNEEEEEES